MVDPWCCPKAVRDDSTGRWDCPEHGDLMQHAIDAGEPLPGMAPEPAAPGLSGFRSWTPDQFMQAIARAIRDRKFRLVAALLKLFGVAHPREAGEVYDAMLAFLEAAEHSEDPATSGHHVYPLDGNEDGFRCSCGATFTSPAGFAVCPRSVTSSG